MVEGHRSAHRVGDLLVIAFVLDRDRVQVIGVHQVAHGAVRDVHLAVHVVVAVLNGVLEHSNYLIGNAVKAHFLAERILAGEKFFLHVGA